MVNNDLFSVKDMVIEIFFIEEACVYRQFAEKTLPSNNDFVNLYWYISQKIVTLPQSQG